LKIIHVVYLKVNLKNKRALLPIHNWEETYCCVVHFWKIFESWGS
jgi:hypothetical protein